MRIVFATTLAMLLVVSARSAQAFDKKAYVDIATATVQQALSGSIADVDAVIADQNKLIAIGVEGAKAYGIANPDHATLMNLLAEKAASMQNLSLDDIEEQWHDGGALAEAGLDFDSMEHFSSEVSIMDSIVHPSTVIIVLNMYKDDQDPDHLDQVKDELSEVLEHLQHIH